MAFTTRVRKGLLVKIAFGREPKRMKKIPGVLIEEGSANAKILWQGQA